MEVWSGSAGARWVWLGEGCCGDYDPADPDDVKLLRLDLMICRNGEKEVVYSACTHFPADSDPVLQRQALEIAVHALQGALERGENNVEVIGEHLSWLSPWELEELGSSL